MNQRYSCYDSKTKNEVFYFVINPHFYEKKRPFWSNDYR